MTPPAARLEFTPHEPSPTHTTSPPHGLHDPALVALPIAIFFTVPFVVLFLALREPDLELGPAFLPIQFQRHDGVAAPLDCADHMIELASVEQQLARAGRVGIDVGRGRHKGADVSAEKKGLAVFQVYVGLGDLRLAGAHAFDLPTQQGNAGLEALLDEVIEARFAVHGNGRQFFGGFHLGSGELTDGAASAPLIVARSAWRFYRFAGGGARAFAGELAPGETPLGRTHAASGAQRTRDLYGRADVRFGQ